MTQIKTVFIGRFDNDPPRTVTHLDWEQSAFVSECVNERFCQIRPSMKHCADVARSNAIFLNKSIRKPAADF